MSLARKRGVLIAAVVIAAALLVPFPSSVVPAWRLRVVDPDGAPVPAIKVRQHWQNYSFEFQGHEFDTKSDADGWVAFPTRAVYASALPRLFVPVFNRVLGGVHASFGPTSMVQAWNNEYEGWVNYKGQGDVPDTLVLGKRVWPKLR